MQIKNTELLAHGCVAVRPATPFARLWRCSLAAVPGAAELSWLGVEEKVRAARFAFERDRRRYLAARCALRERLAEHTGLRPGDLQIVIDAFAKPYVANAYGCHFNLSRRDDSALVGISDAGEIGVDFEVRHVVEDVLALAQSHFSATELTEFVALEPGLRDLAFLRVWTRKEACLKAVGTGLRIEPVTLDVGLGEGVVQLSIALPTGTARVEVCSIDSGPDSVAAIARVL